MASAWVAATVVALCGCGSTPAPAPASTPLTASVTASGVTVTATLRPPHEDRRELEVTFTPQPGFHIYGVDLPAEGIDGLGVPTRIGVRGDLAADGPPATGSSTRLLRLTGLTTELPVYPDGPVTFTLPVRRTGGHRAEVVVSYGACSANACLKPEVDKAIPFDLR
ncbi:hypothetical protein ACIBSV_36045 [Embleya sp. NPDC050154]|uniref:hypothetical protein n=1 Tax=Embleya sp. NPDC050154 TaxID=3363988 RepID=UPI0037AA68BF